MWEHLDTVLLGSIDHSPIPTIPQGKVKCERPDIEAVGNKFFVVWTRRYHHSVNNAGNEPAILECAWVEKIEDPITGIRVIGSPNGDEGRGFELDRHVPGVDPFEIRECAGVPDAVRLVDSTDPYKVAVVYPHQYVFGSGSSETRKFEMRMVTCSFDPVTETISKSQKTLIDEATPFQGSTAPPGFSSPGLILPDLAPSRHENSFWLAYEQQVRIAGSTPTVDGRIKLQYWEETSAGWEEVASKTFKSAAGSDYFRRRRPMLSSYPEGTQETVASIAFMKISSDPGAIDPSANVVYEEWEHEVGSLISPPTYGPGIPPFSVSEWPNSAIQWDDKPAPLHGRTDPAIRRCFAVRIPLTTSQPEELVSFDSTAFPPTLVSMDSTSYVEVRRSSASYHYHDGASNPDYIGVAWEKRIVAGGAKRVWISVE